MGQGTRTACPSWEKYLEEQGDNLEKKGTRKEPRRPWVYFSKEGRGSSPLDEMLATQKALVMGSRGAD